MTPFNDILYKNPDVSAALFCNEMKYIPFLKDKVIYKVLWLDMK